MDRRAPRQSDPRRVSDSVEGLSNEEAARELGSSMAVLLPLVLYFGYTSCPDVCPTELQSISLALDQIGAAAEAVQPLFITVDPERDTPARLADFVSSFHPQVVGLTGPLPAIRKTAIAYKTFFAKHNTSGSYPVDHTGFVYLVGKDGRYLRFLPPGLAPGEIAEAIRAHLDQTDQ